MLIVMVGTQFAAYWILQNLLAKELDADYLPITNGKYNASFVLAAFAVSSLSRNGEPVVQ